MAEFAKMRIVVTAVEDCREDFEDLVSMFREKLCDQFTDVLPKGCSCSVDQDDDVEYDGNSLIVPLLFKGLGWDVVKQGIENLTDLYYVDVDCVFASENEGSEPVGVYSYRMRRCEDKILPNGRRVPAYSETKKTIRPKDAETRHEMFLMAWNGFRAPHRTDPGFFDQNSIGDESFKVDGDLPQLGNWLKGLWTKQESSAFRSGEQAQGSPNPCPDPAEERSL